MNAIKADFKQSIDAIKRRAAAFSEAVWDSRNVGDLVRSAQILKPITPIVNILLKDRKLKNPSAGLSGSQHSEPHPDDARVVELFYDVKSLLRDINRAAQELFDFVESERFSDFEAAKPVFEKAKNSIVPNAWTLYDISVGKRPNYYIPPTTTGRRSLNSIDVKGVNNPFVKAALKRGYVIKTGGFQTHLSGSLGVFHHSIVGSISRLEHVAKNGGDIDDMEWIANRLERNDTGTYGMTAAERLLLNNAYTISKQSIRNAKMGSETISKQEFQSVLNNLNELKIMLDKRPERRSSWDE